MTQPAFVAMGDMHLSHLIWYAQKDIRDDSLVAFTELVTTAIVLSVPLVLLGDLNDTVTPPTDIVEFIRAQVDRCQQARIPIYFIDGNHDKRPLPWLTAISDWPIYVGHGNLTEINGLKVVGFDYSLSIDIERKLADLASAPELPQVLLLHQAVKQGLGFEGASNCDLDWVPAGIPLVLMGDLHAPAVFNLKGGGKALYSGSTHPRSVTEIGIKSMLVINEDLTWTCRPFESQRSMLKATIVEDSTHTKAEFLAWAGDAFDKNPQLTPVLILEYSIDREQWVEDLIEELYALHNPGPIIVREKLKFRIHSKIEQDVNTSDVPTIPQLVDRVVSQTEQPFAHSLVKALTDPKCDPQEVIAAYRARFFATSK